MQSSFEKIVNTKRRGIEDKNLDDYAKKKAKKLRKQRRDIKRYGGEL